MLAVSNSLILSSRRNALLFISLIVDSSCWILAFAVLISATLLSNSKLRLSVAGLCLAVGFLLAGGAVESFLFFVGGAGLVLLGEAPKINEGAAGFRRETVGLWKENVGGIEDELEGKEIEVATVGKIGAIVVSGELGRECTCMGFTARGLVRLGALFRLWLAKLS